MRPKILVQNPEVIEKLKELEWAAMSKEAKARWDARRKAIKKG